MYIALHIRQWSHIMVNNSIMVETWCKWTLDNSSHTWQDILLKNSSATDSVGEDQWSLASSPGPTQKSGKGPGVTCKNSCMCWVSSLHLE